jgi:hypothetical protein
MATPTQSSISNNLEKDSDNNSVIHITYECVLHERLRESASYLYEVACSVIYPVASAHLSMRVSAQNTYRNTASRDIPFTLHKVGATAYVDLLESEQLEVRIVELGGNYNKVFFRAQGQEIIEQNTRNITSTIHRISK